MKNSKGKIRDINSYRAPEDIEDIAIDEELRQDFILDGKRMERELENKSELDAVGEAPALLNKLIDQLRENGKWDDEAYEKAMREDADSEDENTEMKSSEENAEVELQQEESWELEGSGQPESGKQEDITDEADAAKYEFAVEELYKLLPEEDLIALRRGHTLGRIEKRWQKSGKKLVRTAVVCIVVGGMFMAGMATEANKEHVMRIWTEITDRGQNTIISKNDSSPQGEAAEEKDRERIKEKIGINVPQLIYKPKGMTYEECDIDEDFRSARIYYIMENGSQFLIYITKEASDIEEIFATDGIVLGEHSVYVDFLAMDVNIQKLKNDKEEELYKADFIFDNAYYYVMCKIDETEFDKIIKKIIF